MEPVEYTPAKKAEMRAKIKEQIHAVFDCYPNAKKISAYSMSAMVMGRLNVGPTEYAAFSDTFHEVLKDPSLGFIVIKGKNGGLMRGSKSCPCGVDKESCSRHATKQADPLGVQSFVDWFSKPAPIQQQAKPAVVAADNYTCGCGNTKCSTNEKSCWKCGDPIRVKQ